MPSYSLDQNYVCSGKVKESCCWLPLFVMTTASACLIVVLTSSNQGARTVSPSVISSYVSKRDSSAVNSSVHGSE